MNDDSGLVAVFDGGGTSTRAALARLDPEGNWQVLGRGSAGASNPSAVGIEGATAAVSRAWQQAVADAGMENIVAERAVVALAGAMREDIRQQMTTALGGVGLANEIRVVPDLLPILYAVRPDGQGVGVIAGTGSVAFARDAEGRLTVRGGWGYLLGDEGSGYWLGRQAIRRLLDRLERRVPPDSLDRALLESLGVASIEGVKRAIYAADDPRLAVAGVAPLVVAEGERAGGELLATCAESLAELVAGFASNQQGQFSIAASGGLFTGSATLATRFQQAIAARLVDAEVVVVTDPLAGCLALSRKEEFRRPLVVADGPAG